MELTSEQFNDQIPVGTEVLFFPNGDGLPILTARTTHQAFDSNGKAHVAINRCEKVVPVWKLETCSQDQFDEIVKILDVRKG